LSERRFVIRTLLRWLRSRPRSYLTPSPNGTPRATNENQWLPKSRRLRPRTTSVRSGKVITTVSGTPPNSVRRLMPLIPLRHPGTSLPATEGQGSSRDAPAGGAQHTQKSNNNAGALRLFWKRPPVPSRPISGSTGRLIFPATVARLVSFSARGDLGPGFWKAAVNFLR
jgi:hypothetical protein